MDLLKKNPTFRGIEKDLEMIMKEQIARLFMGYLEKHLF